MQLSPGGLPYTHSSGMTALLNGSGPEPPWCNLTLSYEDQADMLRLQPDVVLSWELPTSFCTTCVANHCVLVLER